MGDVAEAVGVSKTTISRYLHGEYAYMSSETKAKIEQVVQLAALDTHVVETTGFLRTGLAWIQAIRLNPEASHFLAGYPRLSAGSSSFVMLFLG